MQGRQLTDEEAAFCDLTFYGVFRPEAHATLDWARALGAQIISTYSHVEYQLTKIAMSVVESDHEALFAMLSEVRGARVLREMTSSLVKECCPVGDVEFLDAVDAELRIIEGERNALAHFVWAVSHANELVLIEPVALMDFELQRMQEERIAERSDVEMEWCDLIIEIAVQRGRRPLSAAHCWAYDEAMLRHVLDYTKAAVSTLDALSFSMGSGPMAERARRHRLRMLDTLRGHRSSSTRRLAPPRP